MDKSRIVKSKKSLNKKEDMVEIDTPTKGVSIPLMITKSMKFELYELGYPKEEISDMTPEKSWEIINQKIER